MDSGSLPGCRAFFPNLRWEGREILRVARFFPPIG